MKPLYQDAHRPAGLPAVSASHGPGGQEAEWKAGNSIRWKIQVRCPGRKYMEVKAQHLMGQFSRPGVDVNFQQAMDTYDWAVKGLIEFDILSIDKLPGKAVTYDR